MAVVIFKRAICIQHGLKASLGGRDGCTLFFGWLCGQGGVAAPRQRYKRCDNPLLERVARSAFHLTPVSHQPVALESIDDLFPIPMSAIVGLSE